MGLNCYRSRERFSELLDGALLPVEHARVQEHLARCERCAGDFELFRRSTELVQGLNPIPVPRDFTARVLSRVHAGAKVARPASAGVFAPRARVPSWRPFAVAAAAAAALAIGMWHWTTLPRAKSGAIPYAGTAPAPAAGQGVLSGPATGQLAVNRPAASASPGARPAAGTAARAARVPGAGVDSLYDQPFENGLPVAPGYDRAVPVSVAPAETSVHIVR